MFISKWLIGDLAQYIHSLSFQQKDIYVEGVCMVRHFFEKMKATRPWLMSTNKSSSFWSMSQVASVENVARCGWFIAFSHMYYLTTWECFKGLYTLSFTHHCAGISAKGMYARQKDCIALFEDVIVYIHHKVHLPLKLVYCVYLKFMDGKVCKSLVLGKTSKDLCFLFCL